MSQALRKVVEQLVHAQLFVSFFLLVVVSGNAQISLKPTADTSLSWGFDFICSVL